jgi:S-adenosylmethionine decarboxylase proenzyme
MNHSFGTIEANLWDHTKILNALIKTCSQFNLSVLNIVQHEFTPYGYTAIILLAESHFSVHSYPESNEIYTDLFTCNPEVDTEKALIYLSECLDGILLKVTTVKRDS